MDFSLRFFAAFLLSSSLVEKIRSFSWARRDRSQLCQHRCCVATCDANGYLFRTRQVKRNFDASAGSSSRFLHWHYHHSFSCQVSAGLLAMRRNSQSTFRLETSCNGDNKTVIFHLADQQGVTQGDLLTFQALLDILCMADVKGRLHHGFRTSSA